MEAIFEEEMPRARLGVLLKYFSQIGDGRDPWRVMYPLDEVLLLLTCATIASSLHWANITWIFCGGSRHFISGSHAPAGCGRWSIVSTRRCSGAASRVEHKADCLLALKGNQPTLEAEVADYFRSAPAEELVSKDAEIEKGHGRIEMRTYTASSRVDWIASDRSYPGEPRFTTIKTLIRVHSRTEYADRCSFDSRFYISSAALDVDRLASGVRGHWGRREHALAPRRRIQRRPVPLPTGHGAKNMAIVRRFALGLVRANKRKGSVKTRRKSAGWNPGYLLELLQLK